MNVNYLLLHYESVIVTLMNSFQYHDVGVVDSIDRIVHSIFVPSSDNDESVGDQLPIDLIVMYDLTPSFYTLSPNFPDLLPNRVLVDEDAPSHSFLTSS